MLIIYVRFVILSHARSDFDLLTWRNLCVQKRTVKQSLLKTLVRRSMSSRRHYI